MPRAATTYVATFLMGLLLLVTSACSEQPADETTVSEEPATARETLDGSLHLLSFSQLHGYAEGWPCAAGVAPTPLAGAAAVRRDLLEQGERAELLMVGDALWQPGSITKTRAAKEGARARAEVIMDAMAEAGVGVWVPGHGDLGLWDGVGLFERARERGLKLLVTNLDGAEDQGVLQKLILQAGTLRVALLSAIPRKSAESDSATEVDASFTIGRPVRRVREMASQILERDEADFIVVLSNLALKSNQSLADSADVHFIIGTTEPGLKADRIVLRHDTGMMFQDANGRQVGHTTLRIVDGRLDMVDLSPLWSLPPALATEAKNLAEWEAIYGSRDPSFLAPRVSPGLEEDFMMKYSLHQENQQWLLEWADYQGSSIAHRAAELPADSPQDAVLAVLGRQGQAIREAVEATRKPPAQLAPTSDISDPAACQSCHEAQFEHWAGTDHSRSWDDLLAQSRHRDSSCLMCHAAGFGKVGGYDDPRHDAPYGGYTCWNCHGTKAYHYETKRGVVEPSTNPMSQAEEIAANCRGCHSPQRSPGFDVATAMARVTCPPMRRDEPALIDAYSKVLAAVERNREQGRETERDDYFEGRALIGLGDPGKGVPLVRRYAKTLKEYPNGVIELAQYLDDYGFSSDAQVVLRDMLAFTPSEPLLAKAYAEMLLEPSNPDAADPVSAAAYLSQAAPYELDTKMDAAELPLRYVQVKALYAAGRTQEGDELLIFLASNFRKGPELQELLDRYMAR